MRPRGWREKYADLKSCENGKCFKETVEFCGPSSLNKSTKKLRDRRVALSADQLPYLLACSRGLHVTVN